MESAVETLLLLLPALWNHFPLLEYDTGGYLARWYEGYLVPSRPAPYGLFLNIGSFFDFWPAVAAQAGVTVWTLLLLLRTHGMRDQPIARLTVFALLAGFTTLPWIASVLLTDIFAGIGVLALYLTVFKSAELSPIERVCLIALAAFAAATHSATLLLLTTLGFAFAILWFFSPHVVTRAAVMRVAATLILGLVLLLSANFMVTKRLAWTPGGYGIVFGRMLEDGIVRKFLDEHCQHSRFRLCAHRDDLPQSADVFLWGGPLFTQLGRFDGLGDEMRTIVLESTADYPWLQAKMAVRAAARQLIRVKTGEGILPTIWHTYGIIQNFTPWNLPAMRAARQQHGELQFATVNILHEPIAYGSMVLLFVILVRACVRRRMDETDFFAATVALALVANACILGPLSNPHDRYGARLVWLSPLAVVLWAKRPRNKKNKRPPGGTGGRDDPDARGFAYRIGGR